MEKLNNFQTNTEEFFSDDGTDENDLLFQFVFSGGLDSTNHTQKSDRNEFRIKVATDLREPQGKRLVWIYNSNSFSRQEKV